MATPVRLPVRAVRLQGKADPIFGARPREELEFLPAALEIVETPPSPLPRITALALTGLLFASIIWACLGKVDVVSTASGHIVPAGGGKVVQPLETGTVTAINVHDGDHVSKGQILIALEPTENLSDRDRLKGELAAARLEVARLESVALGRPFSPPPGVDLGAAAVAGQEARAELAGNSAKLSGLTSTIEQHRAELESSRAEIGRLQALLPLSVQRTEVFTKLQQKGHGSTLQLIEAEEKQQDTAHSLEVQRQKGPEIQAQISSASRQLAEAAAEASKKSLGDLTDAKVKAASLADDLQKAEERLKDRTLAAPVDGTVQELAVHTVGGVVEPGQTLMRIAPTAAAVEVEAKLENKDIGFVRAGMPAEIKVETFPFTRYGLIHAKVITVSSDALNEEPQAAQSQQSEEDPKSDPDAHYLVRLALDHDTIDVDGRSVRLSPGMMVSAEIRTGRRRVISYILSPLAKATREAGRER